MLAATRRPYLRAHAQVRCLQWCLHRSGRHQHVGRSVYVLPVTLGTTHTRTHVHRRVSTGTTIFSRPQDLLFGPNTVGALPNDPGAVVSSCVAGQQYEVKAPSAASDRVCKSVTPCKFNEYVKTKGSAKSDNVCAKLLVCKADEWA